MKALLSEKIYSFYTAFLSCFYFINILRNGYCSSLVYGFNNHFNNRLVSIVPLNEGSSNTELLCLTCGNCS